MYLDYVAKIPLFAEIPVDDHQFVSEMLSLHSLKMGEILFKENDPGDNMYIIVSGEVEVIKALGTPAECVIAVRNFGEFLGEMSLLNLDLLRTASIRATQDTQLLYFSHANLQTLLQRQPAVIYEILRVLSQRLDEAHNSAVEDLNLRNQELRVAYSDLQTVQIELVEKERMQKELAVAHDIQMSILPDTFPEMEGYEFGALVVPARTVGGDLFDIIRLDEHRVGVVIGDVSDKGVPAAIFMAQARALFRAEASRALAPREVLERVNSYLLAMNSRGLFVTAIYGVIDNRDYTFTFARAGHDLPLILMPNGEVVRPQRLSGRLLGVFDQSLVMEQTIELHPNSTLLLYTDGATDIQNAEGVAFGLERLQNFLTGCHAVSAQDICTNLLQHLDDFRQDEAPYDDVTLVVVKVR